MFEFKNLADELKKQLDLYSPDFYRIVDTKTHEVFDYQQGKLIKSDLKCYEIWKMNSPCVNCASFRAIKEDKHTIKLGYSNGQIFLVHALPIIINDHRYSIELIQDVGDSFLLQKNNTRDTDEVVSLISLFNERIMKDGFTNLFNKQYLQENFCSMITFANYKKQPLSLAVLDIDQFKQVNDLYGHLFGDEVLLKIAEVLRTLMNDEIHCVKIGGDEFAIIFENTDQPAAMEICEKLIHSLAELSFELHPEYTVTASYGVAAMYEGDTVESLMDRADRMMYSMKNYKRYKR